LRKNVTQHAAVRDMSDDILEDAKAWLYKSRSVRPLESERLITGLIAEVVRLTNLAENLQDELRDAKKWAMAERAAKWQALAKQPEVRY